MNLADGVLLWAIGAGVAIAAEMFKRIFGPQADWVCIDGFGGDYIALRPVGNSDRRIVRAIDGGMLSCETSLTGAFVPVLRHKGNAVKGSRGSLWILLIGLMGLPSCTLFASEPELRFAEGGQSVSPVRVAVLPMQNEAGQGDAEIAEAVRRLFYNNFAGLRFQDVELFEVDNYLTSKGLDNGMELDLAALQAFGRTTGADAIIQGKITRYSRTYMGLYSQFSIGLRIMMVDTKTGAELFSVSHEETSRSAGLALDPVSAAGCLATNAWHLRHKTFVDTANQLCREMVRRIPQPAPQPGRRGDDIPTLADIRGQGSELPKPPKAEAVGTDAEAMAKSRTGHIDARISLVRGYLQTGQYKEAEALVEQILAQNPHSPLARKMLRQVQALSAATSDNILYENQGFDIVSGEN